MGLTAKAKRSEISPFDWRVLCCVYATSK